jgi:hypothetical protein
MTKYKGFTCPGRAAAVCTRRSDAPTQTRLEHGLGEDHDHAALEAAAFQPDSEFDDLECPLVCVPRSSGLSGGLVRCATGSRRYSRDELETDGRKRQIALDSIEQLTFDDLLDGTF